MTALTLRLKTGKMRTYVFKQLHFFLNLETNGHN